MVADFASRDEVPSVKRHPPSSPELLFWLAVRPSSVQLSVRPSRCRSASVRALAWDAMPPAHLGGTKERTAPTIKRLRRGASWCVRSHRNFRARRSRFSQLDSHTVVPCFPARYPARSCAASASGRSRCASTITSWPSDSRWRATHSLSVLASSRILARGRSPAACPTGGSPGRSRESGRIPTPTRTASKWRRTSPRPYW